ncbi:MAG: alpha/beta fold hydrolase [Candidatus Dormibacteria bacterium]
MRSGTPKQLRFPVEESEIRGTVWPGGPETVVLLHPGVGDRRCWEEMVPWLPDELTVIAFDLRGYGESPSSSVPFTHLGDLMLLIDLVANARSVWLIGSSLGGGIALDAAAEHPDRVSGLVLLAPAISGAPEPSLDPDTQTLVDELEAAVANGTMENAEAEARIWLDGTGPPGRVGGPARQLMLAMNRGIAEQGEPERQGESGLATWGRLESIDTPTSCACGDLDLPFLVERTEEVSRRLPRGRYQTIPGTAHLPYLEQPAQVARLIADAVVTRK